jgi:hypothetical protein
MAPKLRSILFRVTIAVLIAAPLLGFLDYVLPHHAVLRVVGTQVKRAGDGKPAKNQPAAGERDIYYIFAEDIDTKKPRVFRNEDTRWGFPWYLKFNSADIQAAAQSIADERGTAVFTYYGWRIRILSLFPNVTKVVRAEPDVRPIPWFDIAFFVVVIGAAAWVFLRVRRAR